MRLLKTALIAGLAAAATLSACGGGGGRVEPFRPARVISFGDEQSAIRPDGAKYTVNATDPKTGMVTCAANPLWNQRLASNFRLAFPGCNPDMRLEASGRMHAASGAKVTDVTAQIDRQFAAGGFGPTDLVTLMAGANDVIELYAQYPAQSADALGDAAQARGAQLAVQVNRIVNADGRIVLSTIHDLGQTPFAIREKAMHPDTDRAALLAELSRRFNTGLRLNIRNDGRHIGLVLTDELVARMVRFPTQLYGVADAVSASCNAGVAVEACTDRTLVDKATAASHLWATATAFGPVIHANLGNLAVQRATNNPF
ncbi:SGNH/GDSL hydrolase family protein [Roseateles sp. MS654]|uniref:SGNH/GDSL hydrolase family protein n=1 Tax=Roseateles sp. MS654 TaxID=3412685 RepID=UPI003C30B9A5